MPRWNLGGRAAGVSARSDVAATPAVVAARNCRGFGANILGLPNTEMNHGGKEAQRFHREDQDLFVLFFMAFSVFSLCLCASVVQNPYPLPRFSSSQATGAMISTMPARASPRMVWCHKR